MRFFYFCFAEGEIETVVTCERHLQEIHAMNFLCFELGVMDLDNMWVKQDSVRCLALNATRNQISTGCQRIAV